MNLYNGLTRDDVLLHMKEYTNIWLIKDCYQYNVLACLFVLAMF
jgi:hypothetical protein